MYGMILTCTNPELGQLLGFLRTVYNLILIAVPVILILFGAIDLGKAVMAGEEKEIKAATGLLLKRVVAAVAVFLLVLIVGLVINLVATNSEWHACWTTDFDQSELE